MDNRELIAREVNARASDEADARAILDTAAEETRSTTPEEDEQFDRFIASADKRKSRIAALTKLDDDSAALGEAVRSRIGDQSDSGSGSSGEEARTGSSGSSPRSWTRSRSTSTAVTSARPTSTSRSAPASSGRSRRRSRDRGLQHRDGALRERLLD